MSNEKSEYSFQDMLAEAGERTVEAHLIMMTTAMKAAAEYKARLQIMVNTAEAMRKSMMELRSSEKKLRDELASTKAGLVDATARELDDAKATNELNRELSILSDKYCSLQQAHSHLEADNFNRIATIKNLETELYNMRVQLRTVQDENNRLKETLDQAVPYVGSGVDEVLCAGHCNRSTSG